MKSKYIRTSIEITVIEIPTQNTICFFFLPFEPLTEPAVPAPIRADIPATQAPQKGSLTFLLFSDDNFVENMTSLFTEINYLRL
jgi:hypothetical protein